MRPARPAAARPIAPRVLIAALVCGCGTGDPVATPAGAGADTTPEPTLVAEAPTGDREPSDGIDDDERTLWASPTSGKPIAAELLPDGAELFLWLRPKRLLATEEGRRCWRALGPLGDHARRAIEQQSGKPLEQIDRLVIGVAPGESYESVSIVIDTDPQPTDELPLLQREIEQLLDTTDEDRSATLLFSPRFLLGDGGALLRGGGEPLRGLLLDEADDAWRALSLSFDVGRSDASPLYWEARVAGDATVRSTDTAAQLRDRAKQWPEQLEAAIVAARPSEHSAELLAAGRGMLEVIASKARRGSERRQAVVNGYAPPGAGHNLALLAAKLLAEIALPDGGSAPGEALPGTETLDERMRRPVTISFRRESLETAVTILSEAIGAPITIEGRDLQLEGITRNQMLGLDVRQKPAAEALVQTLRRANPDTQATGPGDPRQKLVYVVRDDDLVITTRAAAKKRGDTLPGVFNVTD